MFVPFKQFSYLGLQENYIIHSMLSYIYHWITNIYKGDKTILLSTTTACAWRREFTSFAASRSVASSNTAGWRSCGSIKTVTMTSHCSSIFVAACQPTMVGMRCCFICAAALAYEVIVLVSNTVSHLLVTMEALDPVER